MSNTLTLTEADLAGFRRVCAYLWRGLGRGPYLDIENVSDRDAAQTFHLSRADNPTDPNLFETSERASVTCDALIGASAELEGGGFPSTTGWTAAPWHEVTDIGPSTVNEGHLDEVLVRLTSGRLTSGRLTSAGWAVPSRHESRGVEEVTHWQPMPTGPEVSGG